MSRTKPEPDTFDAKELGRQLRAARKRTDLSCTSVATKIGVCQSYVSQIESGDLGRPNADMIAKLADVYGISAAPLLRIGGYPTLAQHLDENHSAVMKRLFGQECLRPEITQELRRYLDILNGKQVGR